MATCSVGLMVRESSIYYQLHSVTLQNARRELTRTVKLR